ncbi:MAG: putative DNA binding domain-containing protein [Proteobacteria bacterium]|nr:putative DNA binding domain-containing protein [Pseudomonadota bacterium]
MENIANEIIELIKGGSLPASSDFFNDIGLYEVETNTFPHQEGVFWDYKDQFPYSMSDNYFGGILRLVCALHNSFGGIIIFGVHDKKRDPGHNKVRVNIENFNQAIKQKTGTALQTIHREYILSADQTRKVDVLLVPKRRMASSPIKFAERIGEYGVGIIWVREGHEVVEAKSKDLPILYSARDTFGGRLSDEEVSITSSIPPSSATIKEFVGRTTVLDKLYCWLFNDEEPRKFLFGRGGSGKSTIAHQFAKFIASSGGQIPTSIGRPIDLVLFVSAKRASLEPLSGKIHPDSGYDFEDSDGLFRAILLLAGWTTTEKIEGLLGTDLRREVASMLDTIQTFIVIDDIDTLTTNGIDAGLDDLYRILVRSKAGGKVLYTLRNAPSHSIANSIEVPGLDQATEFPNFVAACSEQFKVSLTLSTKQLSEIAAVTERRPLAIEIVIGLLRTASFDQAIKMYQGKEGEEARRYLFQREYSALPFDNRARHFLAALCLFKRPVTVEELEHVLQFSKEQINDCIVQTLEMFLSRELRDDGIMTFALGAATQAFISDVSPSLNFYPKIRANIQYAKSPFLAINPQINKIEFEIRKLLAAGPEGTTFGFKLLAELPNSPEVSQHPTVNLLKGRLLLRCNPPRLADARDALYLAIKNGAKDIMGPRDWYWGEVRSGFAVHEAINVCNLVLTSKQFPPISKAEFLGKRGEAYNRIANSEMPLDPEKAIDSLHLALLSYLEADKIIRTNSISDERTVPRVYSSFSQSIESLFRGIDMFISNQREDLATKMLDFILRREHDKQFVFDLFIPTAIKFVERMVSSPERETFRVRRAFIQRVGASFNQKNWATSGSKVTT